MCVCACVHTNVQVRVLLQGGCLQGIGRVSKLAEAGAQALLATGLDDPAHRSRNLVGEV